MLFSRQILLKEFGKEGQRNLLRSSVLIVGAGGLGCPAFQYLQAMGVGRIGIIDDDLVEETNLHRQILFDHDDIGKYKVDVINKKYANKFKNSKIEVYGKRLTVNNGIDLIQSYDLVLDGSDNFNTKFLINDICSQLRRPYVFGSISQFEGMVSVFFPPHYACYRCLVPQTPSAKIKNCKEDGVLGALPGVFGSIQAMEAVKTLLFLKGNNKLTPLFDRVFFYNFMHNEVRVLKLNKSKKCINHNEKFKLTEAANYITEEKEMMNALVIDVREVNESREDQFSFHYYCTHPLSLIKKGILPNNIKFSKIITICRSGQRAKEASSLLNDLGLKTEYTQRDIYEFKIR